MLPKLKVLHLPQNYGNHPWTLSRAERQLGIKSDLVVFNDHPFYKNYDKNLKINYGGFGVLRKIQFLKWALKNYDVFHFNYGSSIFNLELLGLNLLDLPIIKKAGKKIVFTFQGTDARQKDYFIKHFGWGPYVHSYSHEDKINDDRRRTKIAKIAHFADHIFALNPDLMHILPSKTTFLPYANVDVNKIKPIEHNPSDKIKILHAPSVRLTKGTDKIIQTVKKLSKDFPIELILIENMSHQKANKIYTEADIVIDQLRIGWYGGFAVETMALGIPTIAYIRESDGKKFVPFYNEIPIINANNRTLEKKLINLIQDPALRRVNGKNSRLFVKKYHDPLEVATQTIKIYRGK